MDNHKGAFFLWKDLEVAAATCVHVDAHPDVSNFLVPEAGELEHPELNCGNFLYPAMQDGMVTHLIWILPPHLPVPALLPWAQRELQNWMWLSVEEFNSLRLEDHRVEGTLVGARLTICTVDHLPPLDAARPVLIDIDIDYFFGPTDEIWQSPLDLYDRLSHLQALAVTVARSVEGGYTPPQHRYLGDLCYLCFTGARQEALSLWKGLRHPPDTACAPAWLEAARLALDAWDAGQEYAGPGWDAAAARDDGYRIRPLDVASFYLHRKEYERCLQWIERIPEGNDRGTATYLQGLVALRQGDYAAAAARWGELVDLPLATGLLAAHLHEMRGKAQVALGQDSRAIASFHAALQHAPQNASLWRQLAQAQQRSALPEGAARSYRRAIALAPALLATLQARWALTQLYVAAGQVVLAQAELRQIICQDAGPLAANARLLSMQLERR